MNPEQWLSLKWNGGSTMSDRWLNQSKIIHVLFIFSVVDILLAKKIMKRGIRKTILKMKEKEGLPFAEETTLNFTEDQIIEITKGQEVKVDYKKVEDVCETEKAFYIYMSSVQAIIIPKRVLDQDKEKKLRQILSKK